MPLTFKSLQLTTSSVSATEVFYTFGFNTNTAGPLGSVTIDLCTNYQFEPTDPCTPATGLDASATTIASQSGITDFSLDPSSTANRLVLTRPAAAVTPPTAVSVEFTDIINPSAIGSYYANITTYATLDASGPATDSGILVFGINEDIEIQTEVPPWLLFCAGITITALDCSSASGNFIDFGELRTNTTRTATSQYLTATNAEFGYSVTLSGTTMTAGINVIPAALSASSQTGVSQFGINLRANANPSVGSDPSGSGAASPTGAYNVPNQFRFGNGEVISSASTGDNPRKMTVSYIANISASQPAGHYVATMSYICLANF
jgi:hypothetical protein